VGGSSLDLLILLWYHTVAVISREAILDVNVIKCSKLGIQKEAVLKGKNLASTKRMRKIIKKPV
jgi:hypothetical protein